jgi:hypothetical protein
MVSVDSPQKGLFIVRFWQSACAQKVRYLCFINTHPFVYLLSIYPVLLVCYRHWIKKNAFLRQNSFLWQLVFKKVVISQ